MKKIIAIILVICMLILFINTYLSHEKYNNYIKNLNSNSKNTNDVLIDINDIYKYRVKIKNIIKCTDKEWEKFWKTYENYINYEYERSLKEDLYIILNNIKKNNNSIKELKIPKGDEYISNEVNELLKKSNEIINKLEDKIKNKYENKMKEYFKEYKVLKKEIINLIKLLEEPIFYEI